MGWTHTLRFRPAGEQKAFAYSKPNTLFSDRVAQLISGNLGGASIDPLSQQIWDANPPNGVLCGLFDLQTLTIYLYPIADSGAVAPPLMLPGPTPVAPLVHTPGGTMTSHRQTFSFHFEGSDTDRRRSDIIGFSVRKDPAAGGTNHAFHCQSVGFNNAKFDQDLMSGQREAGYVSQAWVDLLQGLLTKYLN